MERQEDSWHLARDQSQLLKESYSASPQMEERERERGSENEMRGSVEGGWSQRKYRVTGSMKRKKMNL